MTATFQQQFDAIKAAIDAQLQAAPGTAPPDRLAYDYDNVPAPQPDSYVTMDLSRRYLDAFRFGGPASLLGIRVGTRPVAMHADDARELQRRVRQALEDVTLTVAGTLLGPFRFEAEDPVAVDDGWFSSLTTWTVTTSA